MVILMMIQVTVKMHLLQMSPLNMKQQLLKLLIRIVSYCHKQTLNLHQEDHKDNQSAFGALENEIAEGFLAVVDEIVKAHNGLGLSDLYPSLKFIPVDMFPGGVETSASTIEWTMSEMVKNPRVLQLAQEKVKGIFQSKGNVDENRLNELIYLHAIIKETLRLHPAGSLVLPREMRETVHIYEFEIPANTRVLVNVWAIGRDPSYWMDAEKFCPERFLNSSIEYKGTNFEYIPFDAGRRICPGIQFGMSVVQLTSANLLFHFDWKALNGLENLDMIEQFGITLTRKQVLRLIPIAPDYAMPMLP
ncbi:unnamed protein product [Linum tenue]|uniref:Cytochrome P450 n=1 Tax=Linum tenue TaxID=586396 RepID=A0AAV0NBB0_9ROSI|nr:unnamed protein product [Linum tenue]